MDYNILPSGGSSSDQELNLPGRFISCFFNGEADARKGRIGQIANGFVVVHPQHSYILRDTDTCQFAYFGNLISLVIVTSK
jgi:hypothetical protein